MRSIISLAELLSSGGSALEGRAGPGALPPYPSSSSDMPKNPSVSDGQAFEPQKGSGPSPLLLFHLATHTDT